MNDHQGRGGGGASFRALLSNSEILLLSLKGLVQQGKREQHALCEVDQEGIRFIVVDQSRSLQGCVSLGESLFERWYLKGEEEGGSFTFRINLPILLDCLSCVSINGASVGGNKSTLNIAYFDEEEYFGLSLMEGDVITECKIRIMSEEGMMNQSMMDFSEAFKNAQGEVNKAILPSSHLHDAFVELSDLPGSTTIRLLMSPNAPYFRLSTHGQTGSCEIDFPQGEESFTSFICPTMMSFEYRLSLLQQATKALNNAEKTFIRVNSEGMLSMQHMIRYPEGAKAYVDFFVLADVAIEEEEEEVELQGNNDENREEEDNDMKQYYQQSSSDEW